MNRLFITISFTAFALVTLAQSSANFEGIYMGQEKPDLTPRVFSSSFISSDQTEKSAFLHPNGKEFYFTRVGDDHIMNIMYSKLEDTEWTNPAMLQIPNKESYRAFITNDGSRMYFASIDLINQEDSREEYNIWVMGREGELWGKPRPLGTEINMPDALEMHPSVADDGTLFFKRYSFKDDTEKIYYAKLKNGQFLEAKPFEINSESFTEDPFVSPDKSYVIFNPSGPKIFGSMHISFRNEAGNWSTPVDMGLKGELPSLSPDRKYLFFIRNNDVYWVDAKIIESFR